MPPPVRIVRVIPDSPAAVGGLQPEDVIVRVGDVPVEDAAQLIKHVRLLEPGTAAYVVVRRSGHMHQLTVTLGKRPNKTAKE